MLVPHQAWSVIVSTIYTTRYTTVYVVVSRFWTRLPDGTAVLKSEVTRYITPEEHPVVSEETGRRRNVPAWEGEATTAVGALA
jgi:hypothetical protein